MKQETNFTEKKMYDYDFTLKKQNNGTISLIPNDTFCRKPINMTPPFELNETEESDTALSHLQSSAHLKSVVSF